MTYIQATDIAVAIATYPSYSPAARDWDQLDLDPRAAICLVDAELIEWTGDQVSQVHCSLSRHGWGFGAVASALLGALWPPALLAGAIAGGVGDQVLTCFTNWMSSETVDELSRVLRMGPVALVAVMATPEGPQTIRMLERHSLGFAVSKLGGSSEELLRALRDDTATACEP